MSGRQTKDKSIPGGNARENLTFTGNRPGVTGFIPSMEEAYKYPGTLPMGQKLVTSL